MKNILWIAAFIIVMTSCKEKTKEAAEKIIEAEVEEEWTSLFNGTDFNGWHVYNGEGVPEAWKIEEDAMVFSPTEEGHGEGANIVTDKEYTDFVFSFDWKIAEGGNSGIFWGVKEIDSLPEAYQTGPEIQVLDDERHPDAKAGTTHQAGSLYDMVAPSSKEAVKPAGEWNSCIVTINHKTNEGIVVLNGIEIMTFPVNNPEWSEMVSKSKFNGWEHFGKYTTGKIGLQDHGNMVAFKNVKIKEL